VHNVGNISVYVAAGRSRGDDSVWPLLVWTLCRHTDHVALLCPLSTAHFNISALDYVSVSIYGLFTDAFSTSNYMVPNVRIVNVLAEI
jgi:hypothetical protein